MSLIKKYMPSTLFGRSLLILVVPVVLIQVITTYVFFERHWGRMTSHLAYAVSGEMAVIVNSFNAGIDEAESERIFADIQNHLDIRVYFEPGKSLPKTPKNSIAQVWENAVADSLNDELSRQITEPFAMKFDFANKNNSSDTLRFTTKGFSDKTCLL